MKKIILMGRSECGKTTLTQALKGDVIHYHKTQYISHYDVVIDTPGEYAENASLAKALALYTYEADVVGLHRAVLALPTLCDGLLQPPGDRHCDPD